jgi:hypothetical protein
MARRNMGKKTVSLRMKGGKVNEVMFVRSPGVVETEMFIYLPVDKSLMPQLQKTADGIDVFAYDLGAKEVYRRGTFTLTRMGSSTAVLTKVMARRVKEKVTRVHPDDELFLSDEVVTVTAPPVVLVPEVAPRAEESAMPTAIVTKTYARGAMSWGPRAIPTTHNGVNYRSRLEAKFARLLEIMKIPFCYEPMKCAKAGGGTYTIDFFLPEQQLYVELKPKRPHIEEEARCEEMSGKGFRVALMYGSALHQPPFRSELFLGKAHRDYKHHDALRGIAWIGGKKLAGDTVFVNDDASGKVCLDQVESVRDTRWSHPTLLGAYNQLRLELPTMFA